MKQSNSSEMNEALDAIANMIMSGGDVTIKQNNGYEGLSLTVTCKKVFHL